MDAENIQPAKSWEISGIFVPACLFIGMGLGWALGHLVEGLFLGIGVGLLLLAVVHLAFGR